MAATNLPQDVLKQALKEALSETLSEERDLFRDIFEEVFEDVALAEAIRKGKETERVRREEIFDMLEGEK